MAEPTQTMMIPEQEVRDALAPNYVLEKELGRGGMGAVYLARDVRLDRPVAIKFLPPDMAMREDLRARFLQETRTAASFSHPNIVPVHAIEERDRILCFVMGYVEGETLSARVKRAGPMSAADATRLLQEAAWALSYAHGRGVVHRDVKPDNILMDRGSGRAMITDFGIARSQNNTSGLTQVGEIIGTPQYMSPEQAIGETIDARSDLYSLGVVAFFALTGRLPFESSTPHGYLTAHITKTPPPIASVRPDLPAGLSAAVDKLLQKDPAQRFQKGEELAEALDPLRASRREIPPAIRLFHVKSTQVIRNALILTLLAPTIANSAGGDADKVLFFIVILSAVFALMMQAMNGLRELAAQGLSHDDLRNGITAISEEESEARAQMRAAPDWRERRRRQQVRSVIGLVIGALLVFFAVKTRVPLGEGRFHTPVYGAIAITVGLVIVMVTLVYAAAAGGASARLDRKLRALWTGALGRRLYERVQKQVARTRPTVRVVSAEVGPNTLIEQLPKNVRRELGEVTRVIASLVAAQKEMVDREAKLTSSQMEASRGSSGVATDTLDRVITELSDAKQAAVQKREDITTALERIRLELIRLRSGVGNIADVKRESDKARALISS